MEAQVFMRTQAFFIFCMTAKLGVLVGGLYRRSPECLAGRFLYGGSAHLAIACDLLCTVLPSSRNAPG
jgi:hypothetical protein